jgi:Xaa-Pro aminopeptidase
VFDYAERQRRLAERMDAEGVDVLFLAPSADLEYLTGVERQSPTSARPRMRTVGSPTTCSSSRSS